MSGYSNSKKHLQQNDGKECYERAKDLCVVMSLTQLKDALKEMDRDCYRYGTEPSGVVQGDKKVPIERPRVRNIDGHKVLLEVRELVKDDNSRSGVDVSRTVQPELSTRTRGNRMVKPLRRLTVEMADKTETA